MWDHLGTPVRGPGRFGVVDPAAFLADLEAKPATLLALLDNLPS